MAAEYIQAKLGYRFAKPESLNVAVKAAHSSDIDGTSDDGNRGLAVFGTRAFEMTEAYHMIIVEERTKSRFLYLLRDSLMIQRDRGCKPSKQQPLVQE